MKKRCLILAVGALSGSSLAILNPSVDPGAYAPFIGQVNGSTGVVIAPNWVITARHVGGGPFMIGGNTFVPDQIVIADGTAGSPNTDLALMHFATPFSSWSNPLYSEPIGQTTSLAGFGETGGIRPDGTGFDVITGSSGTLRVGVQEASVGMDLVLGYLPGAPTVRTILYDLDGNGQDLFGDGGPLMNGNQNIESGLAPFDSGGGMFVEVGGQLRIVGVAAFVFDGNNNQNVFDFGDGGGYISLAAYEGWVQSVVPEPASIAALGLGALALTRRRRR